MPTNLTVLRLPAGSLAVSISLTAVCFAQAVQAADIQIRPATASSLLIQNSAGTTTHLSVSESGAVSLPGIASAVVQNVHTLCTSSAGLIGPCSGTSSFTLPYAATVNLPNAAFSIANDGNGNAIEAINRSTYFLAAAVRGIIDNPAPGSNSSGVLGVNRGTSASGYGVWGSHAGQGVGVYGAAQDGTGVEGSSYGEGAGVYGISHRGAGVLATSTLGNAARFVTSNTTNPLPTVEITAAGTGEALLATSGSAATVTVRNINTADGDRYAIRASIADGGAIYPEYAAIYGENESTTAITSSSGVRGVHRGGGRGVSGYARSGEGVYGYSVNGDGVVGQSITGYAGYFYSLAANNTDGVLRAHSQGAGPILVVNHGNAYSNAGDLAVFRIAGTNVARISPTGAGYFNGGTFSSGADLAEIVPFAADATPEAADVVEIDPDAPDRFRLSRSASNPLVAGVISTRPGVTLGVEIESDNQRPALALAGRVPVKISLENGPITIGDALTSSSTPGHAMRAPVNPAPGTVIGKALAQYNGGDGGRILMLVWPR